MDKKITSLLLTSIVAVGGLITVIMIVLLRLDSSSPTPIFTPQMQEETVLPESNESGEIEEEEGIVTTDWEVLVELIEACEATSITQTHSKEVRITTKEGFVLKAIEPEIDQIFEVYNNVQDTCGIIPIATE